MNTMQIKNGLLYNPNGTQVRFVHSPNTRTGLNLKYIIQHFTASNNLENVVKRFADPTTKVSAHCIIGRQGEIVQCVPFNIVGFHAGISSWASLPGSMNGWSIGIENVAWGLLTKKGNKFYSWTGQEVPNDEVYQDSKGQWFHTYTREQLETNLEVCKILCKTYPIIDMIGHSDVAPSRKLDPSESYPMKEFRKELFGRENAL